MSGCPGGITYYGTFSPNSWKEWEGSAFMIRVQVELSQQPSGPVGGMALFGLVSAVAVIVEALWKREK